MKTGIVIPFYNGHQWLNRLVESFDIAAHGLECTLIIIDNSPGNDSLNISNKSNLNVEVIREKPGIGYGKACNRGYQLCKERAYDYILIANQDGYVSQNFIHDILLPFQEDDKIMISAPVLKIYETEELEDFFIKYYISQVPELVSDLMVGKSRAYYGMKRISGACFAFRLKAVNYRYPYFFDPLFHMYYEDEDLCHRVLQVNGKIVLANQGAVYYHQHAHTTDLENQETIQSEKLVSDKILRLKDGSKSSTKALYGIFVSTITGFTYHFFRGEFKKAWLHIRSTGSVLYGLSAILKTRKQDLLNSKI